MITLYQEQTPFSNRRLDKKRLRKEMFLKHGIAPDFWKKTNVFELMDILNVPDENPQLPVAHDGGFYDNADWAE